MHTTDTQFARWLSWFADPDSRTKVPFLLPNGWAVATDGRFAVATPEAEGIEPPKDIRESIPGYLVEMLMKPGTHETIVPHARMVEMFGACEHPKAETCPHCSGRKVVDHDCDCEYCQKATEPCGFCEEAGVAETRPEARPVCLWGVPIDANRAAYILEHAPPADNYWLRVITGPANTEHQILRIDTPKWSALLVGMTTDKTASYPELMEATCQPA